MSRVPLYLFVAALAACNADGARAREHSEPAEAEHSDEAAHEELPKKVRLSERVIKEAQIDSQPVRREVLPNTLALPGEIAADPDKSARLSSPIPGRIESVRFREGDVVRRGAVLATLQVPDLGKLRADQAAKAAQATAARSNAERLRILLSQNLAAKQAHLDALAQAEALELEARAAAEHVKALGLTQQHGRPSTLELRAPFDGVAVSRSAVVGQPVAADEVIAELVDLSETLFFGRVFEKDLGRLEANAPVEVQLNAYPKERFEGTVEYIGQRVDPVARTVTARIRLKNRDDRLRIGLFGTAYIATDTAAARSPTLVVPRSALTEVAGNQVVFVQHPDGDFELHEVVLGHAAAGKVEVVSGLREDERVVVEGAFTLKSAVLKNTFAEEEE
ncbi:MAG TPA: efflux RND transporter periplasmic adaptor subunit [Polyangiales bacterium]|nr:efflux RND transporter periplasmic adaptor subunit [Polyangiales bacterium]